MGGLMKYMPLTAVTALVASLLHFRRAAVQRIRQQMDHLCGAVQGSHAPVLAVCAAIAILTSALTLASFIKFFGASFLSRTSRWCQRAGPSSDQRLEVGSTMQVAAGISGVHLHGLLGILPAIAYRFLRRPWRTACRATGFRSRRAARL